MKTKIIVGLSNLSSDLLKQIRSNYMFGIDKHMINIKEKDGTSSKAILVATENCTYLIKVDKQQINDMLGPDLIYEMSMKDFFDNDIDFEFENNL